MILDFNAIKTITQGAVDIIAEEEGFYPVRMNDGEFNVYKSGLYTNLPGYYDRALASCGIKFDFYTNADAISFEYLSEKKTSITYCYFDLYCDNLFYSTYGGIQESETENKSFFAKLPKGEKRITLYFPYSFKIVFKNLNLEKANYIESAQYTRKVLAYGDSITQGFTTQHPSICYINSVVAELNANLINKSVGGGVFEKRLLDVANREECDLIVIALGTNDWNATSKERFEENCQDFINGVHSKFKDSKILVITPLWRKDFENEKPAGEFESIGKFIKNVCSPLDRVYVIDGWNLVPHSETFMADLVLHPSDIGHIIMAERIVKYINSNIFC